MQPQFYQRDHLRFAFEILNQFGAEECKYAVIYPMQPEHISRLLEGKDVFCKYVGRARKLRLCNGTKVLFYASGGSYEIRGEAVIAEVAFYFPSELLDLYRTRLFITESELGSYQNRRPRRAKEPLLVLTLKAIRRFNTLIRMKRPVTVAGLTLTRNQYDALLGNTRVGSSH